MDLFDELLWFRLDAIKVFNSWISPNIIFLIMIPDKYIDGCDTVYFNFDDPPPQYYWSPYTYGSMYRLPITVGILTC